MGNEKEVLEKLVRADIGTRPFSELTSVTLSGLGANLAGRVLLAELEARGLKAGQDYQAVGALTQAAVPLVLSVVLASTEPIDGFTIDFVYPGIKGKNIQGKKVVLLDAWLSEKSYIQTSSIITLHKGNELSLDYSVIEHLGAQAVAIASLVGGTGAMTGEESKYVEVVGAIDQEKHRLPFVYAYNVTEVSTSHVDSPHDPRA